MIAQMERIKKAMKGGAVSSMDVARMRALKSRMAGKDIRERMKKDHKSMEYEK